MTLGIWKGLALVLRVRRKLCAIVQRQVCHRQILLRWLPVRLFKVAASTASAAQIDPAFQRRMHAGW